ncbi:MAG: DNA mismatch repair endonuclease MutL [Clostridia bacterium]|nr:DNA mismatch repair endonuclease MutL [Clostridia bacterium]
MGKINVLSFEVANLIAAGEVVDRPSSAIKELVENSIDAGANRITVEIQRGGVRLMRVTDNGCGISAEDLPVAVRRHATSKILTEKDLSGIETLGFRGEALAAIGAVSDMRIISKPRECPRGARIEVRSGRVGAVSEQGAADGPTVLAENLFANVPARLKFLKRDLTEAASVTSVVEKIAMSHPEIAFRMISDGTVRFETSGDGNLRGVIRAVYGKDFASGMLPVSGSSAGISVTGFITSPGNPRANRNWQIFFINRRYVKIRTASSALEQAYVSYIPPERFPGCVIHVTVNPEMVDVNVHPAKLEVKFADDRPVFDAVYGAVREALLGNSERATLPGTVTGAAGPRLSGAFAPVTEVRGSGSEPALTVFDTSEIIPAAAVKDAEKTGTPAASGRPSGYSLGVIDESDEPGVAFRGPAVRPSEGGQTCGALYGGQIPEMPQTGSVPADERGAGSIPGSGSPAGRGVPGSFRIVGEIFNTYVIVEESDRVTVFDKHAAHERIIFEKLRRNQENGTRPVTLLACPVELILMSDEASAVAEHREEIERTGFEFSVAGTKVSVSGIPAGIPQSAVCSVFESFADVLAHGSGSVELIGDTVFEKALFSAACKAAIKGGRTYPEGYTEYLVRELLATPEVVCCPHGRPVAFEFTKKEADRMFGRE